MVNIDSVAKGQQMVKHLILSGANGCFILLYLLLMAAKFSAR